MKRSAFAVVALTVVWLIFTENFSVINAAVGAFISVGCLYFVGRFLPLKGQDNVDFGKLATFPFYLIAQIYVAGFHVIKIVLAGSKVDIVTLDTKITDEALRVILVDSITLTPGSILLDLDKEKITLLWIRDKNLPGDQKTADEQLKSRLENRLLKAQK